MSDNCKKAIREYLDATGLVTGPLFPSRKTVGCRGTGAISRQQAYKAIHEAARAIGIDAAIGTHTLRKTFGYLGLSEGSGCNPHSAVVESFLAIRDIALHRHYQG